jgi:hypothetical protein
LDWFLNGTVYPRTRKLSTLPLKIGAHKEEFDSLSSFFEDIHVSVNEKCAPGTSLAFLHCSYKAGLWTAKKPRLNVNKGREPMYKGYGLEVKAMGLHN